MRVARVKFAYIKPGTHVEQPGVVLYVALNVVLYVHIAHGQVALGEFALHVILYERLRFLEAALRGKALGFGIVFVRVGIVLAVRIAGPQRVLVERHALVLYAAEHHGANAAVANGQSFSPLVSALTVPERIALIASVIHFHSPHNIYLYNG